MFWLGHAWEMSNRWFLIKMSNVRQGISLGLNYNFFVHVKLAWSQRVMTFQVASHNYVFSCFCNSSFRSSPLNHKEKK